MITAASPGRLSDSSANSRPPGREARDLLFAPGRIGQGIEPFQSLPDLLLRPVELRIEDHGPADVAAAALGCHLQDAVDVIGKSDRRKLLARLIRRHRNSQLAQSEILRSIVILPLIDLQTDAPLVRGQGIEPLGAAGRQDAAALPAVWHSADCR